MGNSQASTASASSSRFVTASRAFSKQELNGLRALFASLAAQSQTGGRAISRPISRASPLSDVVDAPFKTTKKRKMMEKRTHQVRVSSGGGNETMTPVDDGHSWRKYGQKEILGTKHPRGYYRCTHRHSQGCSATKQVQRTDEDQTLFDVIYLDTHTCVHRTTAAAGQATQLPDAHSLLHNLSANLTVKTEGLAVAGEPQAWNAPAPFCFSLTPEYFGIRGP